MKTQLYKLIFGLVLAISPAIPLRAQLVADGGSKAINGTGTNISGALTIGTNGSFTTLLIINGGAVTNSPGGVIGLNSTAKTNQVSVTGTNSTWKVGGTLAVGSAGSFNLLVVSNAGKVFDTVGSIGNSAGGSNNTAVVTDPGSLWTNTLQLMVGPFDSFNRLSISNGAQVFSGGTVIGSDPSQATGGNSNIVILTDPGSAWTNAGKSTVGGGTTGGGEFGCFNQLIISNGAVMRNTLSAPQDHVLANQQYSHNNSMIVTGTNSLFSNRGVGGPGSLFGVGGGGPTNQLLISANGIVETDIGYVGGFVTSSNNSALVTDPGSRWTCTATLYIGNSGSSNQVVVSNSAIIATRNLYVGVASSSNNFLTLAGGNIFATNSLVISNNNFLTGNGAINGNVTNSGTLSPGASIGQIAILGKLTLNASSSNFFEISKTPVTNDNIVGLSNVVYGGILIVTNLSGSLTNGDTFKLFASSNYSGAFSTVILPALSPGLFWTNKLALDGTIRVFNRDPGVDVSHFQGENGISQANWNQMFTEGKRFAFVKATEGFSVLDGTMANNVNRAAGAGLRAGVYHFAHPDTHPTTNGAVQEADYFLSYSGNFIGPGYLRPVLDLEAGSGLSTSNLTDWVIAFCNEIITNRGPSAAPIIYTLQSYATSELDARLTNYDLWIAATGTGLNPATDNPPVTGVFGNWSFWQYNVGSAGGISPIDLDICHSEFKSLDSFLIAAVTNPIAPTITTQPQSRTVRFGNSAAFSVAVSVSSSTPLSYQWQFNGTNIAAATTSVYTRTNSQLTNAGSYTVVITNAAGSITSAVATLTVLNPPPPVPGTVLYSENFDSYSSPSIVTSAGTANGFQIFYSSTAAGFDFSAQFGFNYSGVSSPTTIPSAPHSTNGTTKGLYLTVNKDALSGVAAVNLYPTGQNFTGTFALKFDMWINFPNSGTSTEDALFGINHSGTFTNRVGQIGSDGLFYAMDGDGGVSAGSGTLRDFAVFRGGGSGAIPALLSNTASFGPAPLLGSQFDNADPGFAALFPSKTLSFTTAAGAPGNGWVSVEVRQTTNIITWFLNDTVVAQYANIFGYTNGNILIGYNDNFASPGTADNFAIFDNIRVETVPDIDGNGIADAWEIQYFGQYGIDPDADADGDGMSNLREYYAGTNPTNAASTFRMLSAGKTNNDIRLDWTAVGGHSYVVQSATNSPTGAITNFADLSPVITLSGTNETTTNYTHLGAATNSGGYYRVRLGP